MAVIERLGTISVTVGIGPDGKLRASFVTSFTPGLSEMQGAMSEQELGVAQALQRQVLASAAEFMAYMRNPDQPVEVA